MSTTERNKCGLSSLLPMSCRDRAEAFARHLHSRLRSLDSENDGSSADESSWLASHEAPVAISQPRHASDSDLFFNFGLLESPGSPEEEAAETEFSTLINNRDNLRLSRCESCKCPTNASFPVRVNLALTNSHDSDSSDGPYYDTESDAFHKIANKYVNGFAESPENDQDDTGQFEKAVENHVREPSPPVPFENCNDSPAEDYVPLSDSNYESPVTSEFTQSCNEDDSTVSLKDEDCPSLEYSSTFQDLPQLEIHDAAPETICKESEAMRSAEPQSSDVEKYSSSLNIENDYTIECPLTNVPLNKSENQDESYKESRAFLEVDCLQFIEDDDEVEREERTPRVRRCSSLKTGKTPPGTPSRKKIVRFADVLGLDLADVRTFLDEIPKIPTSAYDDLADADLNTSATELTAIPSLEFHHNAVYKPQKILFPLFQQPGGQPNFLDRVREKNVCLENAVVADPVDLSVKGTVRVRNLDFHKSVHIRYTLDAWKTYADLQATYADNSCDGFSDKFTFLLYAHTLVEGQKVEFAVRFHCKGCQYWDNNYGTNYCFQCLPASNNTTYLSNGSYDDAWSAGFY